MYTPSPGLSGELQIYTSSCWRHSSLLMFPTHSNVNSFSPNLFLFPSLVNIIKTQLLRPENCDWILSPHQHHHHFHIWSPEYFLNVHPSLYPHCHLCFRSDQLLLLPGLLQAPVCLSLVLPFSSLFFVLQPEFSF